MAVFFDNDTDAQNSVDNRTEVWVGFECPFRSVDGARAICGNWCALFEYDDYDGTPAVGSQTRKRATLKCGAGTKQYAEVVSS